VLKGRPLSHVSFACPTIQGMKLGLFDSGLGGLSVLRQLLAVQPQLQAIYLADTAWVPYGTKVPQALRQRIAQVVNWLAPQVDGLVVACNTSAALMHGQWGQHTALPVWDPITAVAESLTQQPHIKHVGVMATPVTVASQAYMQRITGCCPTVRVSQVACPGLADAVEQNTLEAITPQLTQWLNSLWTMAGAAGPVPPQQLVLGCTHYPFATQHIVPLLPSPVPIIDPARLMALHMPLQASATPGLQLVTTGSVDAFKQQLLALPLPQSIQQASIIHCVL
jgi:glutamate racemase